MVILSDYAKAARSVLLLVCVLGLVWFAQSTRAENKRLGTALSQAQTALETANRIRAADQAVAGKYAAQVRTLQVEQRKSNASLKAALAANAPWADQNVPADVAAALGL